MDEELKKKLMESKGCGSCAIDFAEGVVSLCETRGKGEECKRQSVDIIVDFLDGKISNGEFMDKLKGVFGQEAPKTQASL